MGKTVIIIVGHGSRSKEANTVLDKTAKSLKAKLPYLILTAALQFNKPSLSDAIKKAESSGFTEVVILPFFLYNGIHANNDIPKILEKEKKLYPKINFSFAEAIGDDYRIHEILLERINKAMSISSPAEIEKASFEWINSKQNLDKFGRNRKIAERIIHASGDLSLVNNIIISPTFLDESLRALKSGCVIFCDVKMVMTGINKKNAASHGNNFLCLIDDKNVVEKSTSSNTTRASISVREAVKQCDNKSMIFVIGNAPTALFEICKLIENKNPVVASVIGMPVGFVGASESKELLAKQKIPYATIRGTKGGSALAVSTINALFNLIERNNQ